MRACSAFALLASLPLSAQEHLWQVAGGDTDYNTMDHFGDFNGDGRGDLLVGVGGYGVSGLQALRIVSGLDGSTLFERPGPSGLKDAGDMDFDGQRDYFALGAGRVFREISVDLRTFSTGQIVWSAYGSDAYGFAHLGADMSLMTGKLDLNGDGRGDFLVASSQAESIVYAYSNSGALLYQLPVSQFGWVANNVTAMPDLDGDGGDDFLVGCNEPSGRGAVVVVSGRSGALLRISYGLLPGDLIGGAVCNAGDVDQDGMADYAAASYWSSPQISIVIYSGRTGAPIRSWNDYWTESGAMIGDIDVDLDGIPDLLVGCYGCAIWGQIRAYSGRDGSVLWNLNSTSSDRIEPQPLINLGVQPGSPYPVIAYIDRSWNSGGVTPASHYRVVTVRTNLPGAGPVSGSGCASVGGRPQIGMRQVFGRARITVSGGTPGALAWLVGGPAGQSTFDGVTLPYALDAFGLFGCTAHVPPVVSVPMILGASGLDRGYAAYNLPLPWRLGATGITFAAQWLLLDPPTGSYAVSARHEFRVR